MTRNRIRWSDNDHYFGPFTYARAQDRYRPLALVLGSGDGDDYPGCRLRLSGFGHTLILALPAVIKPWRREVVAQSWDAATTARMGRNWYWDTHEREYGFSYSDGFLQVFLGRQTHDSDTTQSWSKHLPWTQWRHVRRSLYGLQGEHFWTEPKRAKGQPWDYDAIHAAEESCPSRSFIFTDFDGEQLTARTRIEEREWRFGEGWFKWLSIFRRPMVRRSLDIQFSGETGKRKGSWKGGTIGHSINMLPGELHDDAFIRHCVKEGLTYLGPLPMLADLAVPVT